MSFFSKLFGRKKSKTEDRRIESEVVKVVDEKPKTRKISADEVVAGIVKGLKNDGSFNKPYKLIDSFIEKMNPEGCGFNGEISMIKEDELGDEVKKFVRQYQVRGLKCSNAEFQDWITNLIV